MDLYRDDIVVSGRDRIRAVSHDKVQDVAGVARAPLDRRGDTSMIVRLRGEGLHGPGIPVQARRHARGRYRRERRAAPRGRLEVDDEGVGGGDGVGDDQRGVQSQGVRPVEGVCRQRKRDREVVNNTV